MYLRRLIVGLASALAFFTPMSGHAAGQWVTYPGLNGNATTVLHFRREIELPKPSDTFIVQVSADNRFILYVNGKRVGQGPARGDLAHWRYATFDLAPFLKRGHNVVAAEVWNAAGDTSKPGFKGAPMAQISARTGFWLQGNGAAQVVDSGPSWRVAIQPGHGFASPFTSILKALKTGIWYAAGGNETIDGTKADWNWTGDKETAASWTDAIPALSSGEVSPWNLTADPLPAMSHASIKAGKMVRSTLPGLDGFPGKPVIIPANTEASVLIDQSEIVAAYPELTLSGGNEARVTVTYSEALYDDKGHKADRNAVEGRKAAGPADVFIADGGDNRVFRPLWWRTWRYMEISIKTGHQPLTLGRLKLHEDVYPFAEKGYFRSRDPELNRIWDIGWRTLRIDAHETFMDSAYWEQLQYVGDTRLENLIVYPVSGDPRLPVQAIDAFGQSAHRDGMIESAYPSNSKNIIPTFGLLWIGMIHDYWMQQPDQSVVTRNLPGVRRILDWYAPYIADNGLLKRNPEWNFVDWVGDPSIPREKFPSFDPMSGTSCLTSLFYLGALQQAADMEGSTGDAALANSDKEKATSLSSAIQNNCWDERRGLYADDPSKTIFSQHSNALAVLYDVALKEKAADVLSKVTLAKGIDAPEGILESSYYFSWYLIHAFDHAGLGDRYLDQLQTWRDLTQLNYTTWPEQRGNTRSDTHAWSAHPTADLLGIVAGVGPASPGYTTVRIAPHLGELTSLEAGTMTPKGLVQFRYRMKGREARFAIELPKDLNGTFEWKGNTRALKSGSNAFTLHSTQSE